MDGPIPIIIVTSPEGRRTRLRTDGPIPAIIVTSPEGIPTTIATTPKDDEHKRIHQKPLNHQSITAPDHLR
jgi:hypothetical protein